MVTLISITYWWPVLVAIAFILLQAFVGFKYKVKLSFALTILFTVFTFFVSTFFNLVIIHVFLCVLFWSLSFLTYFQRSKTF